MKLNVTFTQEEIDKAKQLIKEGKSFCHAIRCNCDEMYDMCPLAGLSDERAIKFMERHRESENLTSKGFCGSCKHFNPNGGVTSDGVIYSGHLLSVKLGYCDCPIEPKYSRLKNEHNGCDNWVEKEPKIF